MNGQQARRQKGSPGGSGGQFAAREVADPVQSPGLSFTRPAVPAAADLMGAPAAEPANPGDHAQGGGNGQNAAEAQMAFGPLQWLGTWSDQSTSVFSATLDSVDGACSVCVVTADGATQTRLYDAYGEFIAAWHGECYNEDAVIAAAEAYLQAVNGRGAERWQAQSAAEDAAADEGWMPDGDEAPIPMV